MTDFLKRNTAMKLFSVLLAVLMWIYVVQIENPLFEVNIQNIPIQLQNSDQLKEKGLMISEQSTENISIRAKGKRQSVIGLKAADVVAGIDVSSIRQPGSYSFAPQLSFPDDSISVVEKNPRSVTITVDTLEQQTREITAEVIGSPKDGFYAATPELYQKDITLQGPTSQLNQISKIVAVIDVTDAKKDVKKQVKLQLLRADGTPVDSDKVVTSTSVVTVICKVYPTKKVKLEYDVTGTCDVADYSLQETRISNSSVTVAGREEALEALTSINIGTFDLSEVTTKNYKKVFSIPFESDIISVDGIKNVAVEAVLVSDRKKLMEISNFSLENVAEGMQASVITPSLQIELEGAKSDLSQVMPDSIQVLLDLSGCVDGNYQIHPKFQCSVEGVKVIGDYTVDVFLK